MFATVLLQSGLNPVFDVFDNPFKARRCTVPPELLYFEIPHPQRIGLHKRKAVRREKDSLLKTKPHIEYLLVRFLNFDILMPGNPASLPSQLVVDMLWNWYLGALW